MFKKPGWHTPFANIVAIRFFLFLVEMNDNIKVSIRIRPQIDRERSENARILWESLGNTVRLNCNDYPKSDNSTFTFDTIFDPESANEDIFKQVVKPIIDDSFYGYNGTVFAYGQTASGKTHTMTGNEINLGIIPMAVNYIFQYIDMTPGRTYLLRVSFIEIYNEIITDLLDKDQKSLKIFEDVTGMPSVADVTEVVVTSAKELLDQLKQGEHRRQFGETSMNERSSRSHTIFKMVIESHCTVVAEKEDEEAVVVAHVNLVDLAGSEKCGQVNSNQTRFKEGCRINLSLLALSQVISKLSEGNTQFINFRDSKLTRILKPSLGGNSKTAIICNISPCVYDESLTTLKFAERARSIKNKPKINEILSKDSLLKKYESQIQQLKEELTQENKSQQCQLLQKELNERDTRISELQEKLLSMSKKLIVSSHPFHYPKISKANSRRETWCAPLASRHVKLLNEDFQINSSFAIAEDVPLDESKRNSELNLNSQTLSFFEDNRVEIGVQTEFPNPKADEGEFSKEFESVKVENDLLKKNYEDIILRNEELSRELEVLGQKSSEQKAALFDYESQITAMINSSSLLECGDKIVMEKTYSEEKIELVVEQQRLKTTLQNLENEFQKEKEHLNQSILNYKCNEELLQDQNTNYKMQIEEMKEQLSLLQESHVKEQESAALTISELKTSVENSLQINEIYQTQLSVIGDQLLETEKEKKLLDEKINDSETQLCEREMQLLELQRAKEQLTQQINETQTQLSECANQLVDNEQEKRQHNQAIGEVQTQLMAFTDNLSEVEQEKEQLERVICDYKEKLEKFEEFIKVELEAVRKSESDVCTDEFKKSYEDEIIQLREENQMMSVIIDELKNEIITTMDENERLKEDYEKEKLIAEKLTQQIDVEKENDYDGSVATKAFEEQINELTQKNGELELALSCLQSEWDVEKNKFEIRISEEIQKQDDLRETNGALVESEAKFKTKFAALELELNSESDKLKEEINSHDYTRHIFEEHISQLLDSEIKLKDDLICLQKQIIKEKEESANKVAVSEASVVETKEECDMKIFEVSEELVQCQSNLELCLKDNSVLNEEIAKCAESESVLRRSYEEKQENAEKIREEKQQELRLLEKEIDLIRDDSSARIESLNVQLAESEDLKIEYEDKISALTEILQCTQTEFDSLERQKEESEIMLQGKLESLEIEANEFRNAKKSHEDELEKLSALVQSAQSEARLQRETFEKERENRELMYQQQVETFETDYIKIQEKNDNLIEDIAKLKEQIEYQNLQADEVKRLENVCRELTESYEQQIIDWRKQCDSLQEYKNTVDEIMETSRVQMYDMYDIQTADFEKEQSEHLKTKTQLENTEAELSQVKSELEVLKAQISGVIENKQTTEINSDLKKDYEEKISEMLNKFKETEEKLTKRINFLEDDRKTVKGIIESQRVSFFALVDEKSEELEKEEAEHVKTKAELEELKKMMTSKPNCSSTNRSNRSPLQQITSLSNIQKDSSQKSDLNEQEINEELLRTNEKLRKEVAILQEQIQRCDEAKLNQELLIKDCKINELKMHIKKQEAPLKKQLENLKTDCSNYQQKVNSLKRDLCRMQQLDTTTSDYQKTPVCTKPAYDIVDNYKIQQLEYENNQLRKLLNSLQEAQFKRSTEKL